MPFLPSPASARTGTATEFASACVGSLWPRGVVALSLSSRCVGETDGREREVRGTYKKVWKYLPPE
jgi:hypothetical protein